MEKYLYIHDPDEIYKQSFARINGEIDLKNYSALMGSVVTRVVHASAMVEVVEHIVHSPDAAEAGRDALVAGAEILVDAHMVVRGITKSLLPANNQVSCFLDAPGVADEAKARCETRSSIGVERWAGKIDGAICVIGNAPTALFRLLEMLDGGLMAKPALIIGFPVGFVGADESKQALIKNAGDVAFITIGGRLGGSAMAAAVVNAIAKGE